MVATLKDEIEVQILHQILETWMSRLWGDKQHLKGELHSNSWNLTFVNKLQFPLILRSFVFKASKT